MVLMSSHGKSAKIPLVLAEEPALKVRELQHLSTSGTTKHVLACTIRRIGECTTPRVFYESQNSSTLAEGGRCSKSTKSLYVILICF